MRIDGHPWLQAPSGSTMQPSVQHAGDVASHIALRVKSSRLSGVNPSFSRASVAVIRYGFCFVVFIILYGHQLPAEPTGSPMDPPENSSFDEVTSTLAMGWNVNGLESAAGARTELAHSARGTDCFGSAQAFVGLGFGSDTKSTPTH